MGVKCVIKNAVGVKTLNDKYIGTQREDTNLKQMYVLTSAFSDDIGVIPDKLEVKEFNDKANKLYLSVVLKKRKPGSQRQPWAKPTEYRYFCFRY